MHAGHEAYFVGGAVRDYLLQRPISDVDIVTSATIDEVIILFPQTIEVGTAHETVIVKIEDDLFEVSRYKGKEPRTLEQDLFLRDFTVNAIALTKDFVLIDPHQYKVDLDYSVIRASGCANDRFKEDPLRMVRAVRFISQLGFSIEQETRQAMLELKASLSLVANERLAKEIDKLLLGPYCSKAIAVLHHVQFSSLPILPKELIDWMNHPLYNEMTLEERWFLLLRDVHHPVETQLRYFKKSNRFMKELQELQTYVNKRKTEGWSLRLLYDCGKATIIKVERLIHLLHPEKKESIQHLLDKYEHLRLKKRQDLAINGSLLLHETTREPGSWIEGCLHEVETAVIYGELPNEKNEILAWSRKKGLL
ncbi:CCA tRNA nucleotidyltransferase [Alkalihalobacillus sp. LMS39]|nr:CCA tRNA nucleotidyltransferase [Alkalihalobacillus sp. LMS39]UOE96433.1 CCA tRNA nucleotidyltransferase [Alkalihalobacillus sp. LMS39]